MADKVPTERQRPSRAGEPLSLEELSAKVRRIAKENQSLFQQLMAGEKRLRHLAKAVWRVQEEERRRLADELHDGLGQTLAALKMQVERLAIRAEKADEGSTHGLNGGLVGNLADGLAKDLRGAADLASVALDEARRASHMLRPQILDDLGLEPALRWLARTLKERTGFQVELEVQALESRRLDQDLETMIFRVAQESLTNALKHSEASGAKISVVLQGNRLRLCIVDQGKGFDTKAALSPPDGVGGHGLRGIRDRVEVFGGRLRLKSRPGAGTRLEAELPVDDGSNEEEAQ